MTVARRVAVGAGSQMAARILVMLLGLVAYAVVARHLGRAGFGAYSLVIAAIPLLATLLEFGIATAVVREIARFPGDAGRIVSTTLTVVAVLGLGGALLAAAALPLLGYETPVREAMLIALPGLVVLLLAAVPGIVFQSALRLELQAGVDLLAGALGFGSILAVVALGGGLRAIVLAWLAAITVSTALAYAIALRLLAFRPRLDRALARTLVRRAVPIGLASVAAAVHFRVDTVLLSLMKPISDVGIYGVAFRFLEHGLFAPLLLMNALFPVLAGYVARDDPRLAGTVRKTFTLLLLLAVPSAVVVVVLADPLIELLVGPAYGEAATPLRILGIAVLFAFVNPLFTNILVAADLQARVLAATLVAIVLNVGLNLLLIPRFSYDGAAAATAASEAVGVTLVAWWASRRTAVRPDWGLVLRVAGAAAVMGAVLAALSGLPVLVTLAAGAAVYAALVVALKVLGPADLRALRPTG